MRLTLEAIVECHKHGVGFAEMQAQGRSTIQEAIHAIKMSRLYGGPPEDFRPRRWSYYRRSPSKMVAQIKSHMEAGL